MAEGGEPWTTEAVRMLDLSPSTYHNIPSGTVSFKALHRLLRIYNSYIYYSYVQSFISVGLSLCAIHNCDRVRGNWAFVGEIHFEI